MTIGSILLAISLFLVVLAFVARPFFISTGDEQSSHRMALLAEKDALLTQIQTLDFEFETGKLPEADYQQERDALIEQAAHVLQQFDTAVSTHNQTIDDKIEAAIAQLRGTASQQTAVCPNCSGTVHDGDKFCAHCGQKLEPTA